MPKYLRHVKRDGDIIRSTYIGSLSDPLVQVLQRRERLCKAERNAKQREHLADKQRSDKIDYLLDGSQQQLLAARRVWLRTQSIIVARDGTWQRKVLRQSRKETVPVSMSRDDFEELLALAETGNETALQSLRKIMAADRDTWFPFGDLQTHARKLLLDSMTRGNTIARESLHINLEEMREELRDGHDNCIRDLAIDHVVTCWLDIHRQTLATTETSPSRSAADFNDRRLERSQKRYRNALKFLNDMNVQLGIQPVAPETESEADAPRSEDCSPSPGTPDIQCSATPGGHSASNESLLEHLKAVIQESKTQSPISLRGETDE